ncbi:ROK family protein [Lapidilactobacillus salsurivasis]
MTLYGAIEAGGTKFVLAVGDEKYQIVDQLTIPTETPAITMAATIAFFRKYRLTAIGLGTFGPVDLNPQSPTYGYITNTPKQAWVNYPIVATLTAALQIPVMVTTDVNVSCYGEYFFGNAQQLKSCLYYTVGTGIGAGAINRGQIVGNLAHPEMGHVALAIDPRDTFAGCCPYHGNCLEGMASGTALTQRTGQSGRAIPATDPAWELIENYLGQAIYNASLTLDPEVIVLGGGVMKQPRVIEGIRRKFLALDHGYRTIAITDYIQPARLADQQGILGCLVLAMGKVN